MIGNSTPGGSGFGGGVDGSEGPIGTSGTTDLGRRTAGTAHEAGAQEPVVRAGSGDAAAEQIIVESARPEFASGKGERPRSSRGPADRAHNLNAVDGRFRTHATDIGHVHRGAAGGGRSAPLMTNRSEGEPSPPSTVLMAIVPPTPV